MRFWSSSEAMIDINDCLRQARNTLEDKINSALGGKSYGDGILEWAIIYIILDDKDENFPEVKRYHKRRKVVEFRIAVDHASFKSGTALSQCKLLASAVLESIGRGRTLKIQNFDLETFHQDILTLFTESNLV